MKQAGFKAPAPVSTDAMTEREIFARKIVDSSVVSALVVQSAMDKESRAATSITGLVKTLREQSKAIQAGDMGQAEAMLINQAVALQSLFTHLTEQGLTQSHMPNLEGFMRLALRAQSQCRATLETLSAIKNPPVIFAKQANVTTGPQQINNGTQAHGESQSPHNELSGEQPHELRENAGTPRLESRANQTLETVGEIHRAKISSRKSTSSKERR